MSNPHLSAFSALAALAISASSAMAQPTLRTASGVSASGAAWTAISTLVGTGSTATLVSGGSPSYTVASPFNGGLVSLNISFGGGSAVCTGTLLEDRRSILTAAHCVTDNSLNTPDSTAAFFYGGTDPDTIVGLSPVSTRIEVESYRIHSLYTGDVIDQNDIAVLRLAEAAPGFAPSFGLFTGDLSTRDFTVMGYGLRSVVGGSMGANLSGGRLRQGDNRYDFRMGDSVFGSGWATLVDQPFAQVEHTWLSDFDSGLAQNDLSCRSVQGEFGLTGSPTWCNLGRGFTEVGTAGGDSGGPGFIDGRIASITSFGLTFTDPNYGDVDAGLNSSFGEFSGYVPVYLHADFIASSMVPEPATWAMSAAGLLVVLGSMSRRRAPGARRALSNGAC